MSEKIIEVEFVDASGNRGVFGCVKIISIGGRPYVSEETRADDRDRLTYLEGRLDTIERALLAGAPLEEVEGE